MFTFALFSTCFDLFRLKIRSDGVTEDSWDAGVNECRLLYKAGYYLESIQKGTPPPI